MKKIIFILYFMWVYLPFLIIEDGIKKLLKFGKQTGKWWFIPTLLIIILTILIIILLSTGKTSS